jgi:serine protease Do
MIRLRHVYPIWGFFIGTAVFLSAQLVSAQEAKQDSPRQSPAALALKKAKPALVFIQGVKENGEREGKDTPLALGVIIDPKGTVVTNHSSIKDMKTSEIVLSDGRRLPAKALFSDPDLDLAIIKVEAAKPLPSVGAEDSDLVKVGDWVIALSAPFTTVIEDPLMVVAGVIGGKTRATKKSNSQFLVDTAIGPGCGPGPLLSREGRFVGLVVSRRGFAIPSNRVTERAAEWSRKK